MKCARCGHVWKTADPAASALPPARPAPRPAPIEAPPPEPEPIFAAEPYSAFEDEIPMESQPSASYRDRPDPVFDDEDLPSNDVAMDEMDALGFTGEGSDPFTEDDAEDPFSKMSELMRARQPESMPNMFTPARPKKPLPRRKGAFILWVLLLFLVLAASALGLYFFQDRLIDHWPSLSKYYEQIPHARRDEIGAGLSFRNYNSERLVQDNNEVLIVRGVIANGTEQKREIPLLRLALYNGATLLQEKVISPPQETIDGKATVGFKVTLDQPSADATRFEVTFIATKAADK
jgi:hypothetical protein